MKYFLVLLSAAVICVSCHSSTNKTGNSSDETASPGGAGPTDNDIISSLKSTWEHDATAVEPKKTVTINKITRGTSEESNYAQQLDGVPKGAEITHAKIDFTQNLFYNNEAQHVRRIMTALVYKDQFSQWAIMNTGCVYP